MTGPFHLTDIGGHASVVGGPGTTTIEGQYEQGQPGFDIIPNGTPSLGSDPGFRMATYDWLTGHKLCILRPWQCVRNRPLHRQARPSTRPTTERIARPQKIKAEPGEKANKKCVQ